MKLHINQRNSTDREKLNAFFNAVIVQREITKLKEKETRARFLAKSSSSKKLTSKS